MSKIKTNNQLLEEIKLYIRYGVPEDEYQASMDFVDQYINNIMVLRLLADYYSTLPEGREEAVVKIAILASKGDVTLFVLQTTGHAYLYAVSVSQVVWLGEYGVDVDPEILKYFGYGSQEEFHCECVSIQELRECDGGDEVRNQPCPACGVLEGEYHLLGCSVEVCPWCDGQLSKCNCRFEQLQVEELTNDEELERFADLLSAKGRIPYKRRQKPAYPGTSCGLDYRGEEE